MNGDERTVEELSGGFFHLLNPFEIPDEVFAAIVIGCVILVALGISSLSSQHMKIDDETFAAEAERRGFVKLDAKESAGDR